ncbi:hypothetical protein AB1K83_02900 [Sporosarcina sp. 179-K 3D1 HS]|uniref:hypothetical protein n=1 Tax=Sporosarcina sp. 179-K 3D1 HS TaxID=3232169 RepID=UPI00399F87E8
MFEKPEDVRMTREEMERYGRNIDARNAAIERVEVEPETVELPADQVPPPLSEEEIKLRVGEQNYINMKDGKEMNSINS